MSNVNQLVNDATSLADKAADLSGKAANLTEDLINLQPQVETVKEVMVSGVDPFIFAITVFILACFVGYYVVWKVTPALHSPLMSVTNAISSVIIVGAVLAAGSAQDMLTQIFGFGAVVMASINIFGGFVVTRRMLEMFNKKK